MSDWVKLAPENWQPNPAITGGNRPPQELWITPETWVEAGRPQSIEEFYRKLTEGEKAKER